MKKFSERLQAFIADGEIPLSDAWGRLIDDLKAIEAHPAPSYPDTLPCPVRLEPGLLFGKGVPTNTMLGALQRRSEYYAELEAMTPEERAKHDANIEDFKAMLPPPPTAPEGPE